LHNKLSKSLLCEQERVVVERGSSSNQRRLSVQVGGAYLIRTSTGRQVIGANVGHVGLWCGQLSTELLGHGVQGWVTAQTGCVTWSRHVICLQSRLLYQTVSDVSPWPWPQRFGLRQ